MELQKFLNFCAAHSPVRLDIETKFPYFSEEINYLLNVILRSGFILDCWHTMHIVYYMLGIEVDLFFFVGSGFSDTPPSMILFVCMLNLSDLASNSLTHTTFKQQYFKLTSHQKQYNSASNVKMCRLHFFKFIGMTTRLHCYVLCSTKHSTWYYVKESLYCIKCDFIVIFNPQNMGVDNFKNKISQILPEILTNSVFGNGRRYWLPANFEWSICKVVHHRHMYISFQVPNLIQHVVSV